MSDIQSDDGAFARATGRCPESGRIDKPRYRQYQYDLIAPHCGRSVLEVGAGLGEFAALFSDRERVVVTDTDPEAVELLEQRFAGQPEIRACQLDLDQGVHLDEPVESVIAINVLEHLEDDAAALRALARHVTPGGTVVLWVPAYPSLYGEFDRLVGHYRRYTPASARETLQRAGLGVEVSRAVNALGGLAWWAAVRRGGARSPQQRGVGLYDRLLVPASRALDPLRLPFGQSVLCVGRVPG